MRILWLDEACRHNRYDDWLHWKFAKSIASYADIFFYAPFMHEKEPKFTPIPYQRNILLKDLVNELKIDCVILDTKGGAYHNYLPDILYHDKHGGHTLWLPKDFKDCDVKKICIEEDFQYETSYDWHEDLNFDLILQRHYIHMTKFRSSIPIKFFPFSVDTSNFYDRQHPRMAKIGFACTQGTGNAISGGSVYKVRELAYYTLFHNGYLGNKTTPPGSRIEGDSYLDYLQRFIGYICCGSIYNLTPAKMTEIIASGGILFMNRSFGVDKVLTDDTYIRYADDCSDLIDKVRKVMDDKEYRDTMIRRGHECIENCHTHKVRINELLTYIKEINEGSLVLR